MNCKKMTTTVDDYHGRWSGRESHKIIQRQRARAKGAERLKWTPLGLILVGFCALQLAEMNEKVKESTSSLSTMREKELLLQLVREESLQSLKPTPFHQTDTVSLQIELVRKSKTNSRGMSRRISADKRSALLLFSYCLANYSVHFIMLRALYPSSLVVRAALVRPTQQSSSSSRKGRLSSTRLPVPKNRIIFERILPEGNCAGIQGKPLEQISLSSTENQHLVFDNLAASSSLITSTQNSILLHPQEIRYAQTQYTHEKTQQSFLLGRLAVRYLTQCSEPILKDPINGRPQIISSSQQQIIASISHKDQMGVALVAEGIDACKEAIGVDLERVPLPSKSQERLANRILTPSERASLGRLQSLTESQEVLLRFSIKESIYKAMHPLLCEYIGFQDAQVTPLDDGNVKVDILHDKADLFQYVKAHWQKIIVENTETTSYFLTSASAELKVPRKDQCESLF